MESHEDVVLLKAPPEDDNQDAPHANPHRMFGILEVLHMIAEKLHGNNQALCDFSRVSKAFQHAGIPVLYRDLYLPIPELFCDGCLWPPRNMSELDQFLVQRVQRELWSIAPRPDNRNLQWVRNLRCGSTEYEFEGLDEEGVRPVHWLQVELLPKLTGLKSYQCIGMPPNPPDICRLQKCCPNISVIDISYPRASIVSGWAPPYYSPMTFKGFRDLTRLCLSNMYGSFGSWRRPIVSSLRACPGLTYLSLGFEWDNLWLDGRVEDVGDDARNFLTKICLDYAGSGASRPSPLHLRTIHLGHGFWLLDNDSSAFPLLVDPCYLEEVHLDNQFGWRDEPAKLDLSLFSKTTCPKLKQITFEGATPQLCAWVVNMSPDFSEQLAVYFRQVWDKETAESDEFDTGWIGLDNGDWGWYDQTELGLTMVPRYAGSHIPPLRGLQLGGRFSLETPPDEVEIVLGPLARTIAAVHGHCLEELCLWLGRFRTVPSSRATLESFQCDLVSRLPNLQNVVLMPALHSSDDANTYEQRQRMAHVLALASGFQSRLRRILLTIDVAVELVRSPGEHGFSFRQMTLDEADSIPMFKFHRLPARLPEDV